MCQVNFFWSKNKLIISVRKLPYAVKCDQNIAFQNLQILCLIILIDNYYLQILGAKIATFSAQKW